MTIDYPCGISKNKVKQDDTYVQLDQCNKLNHIECIGLSSEYYEKLQNGTKPWHCPNCSNELPFSDVRDKDHPKRVHFQSNPQKLMHQIKSQKDLCINSSNLKIFLSITEYHKL